MDVRSENNVGQIDTDNEIIPHECFCPITQEIMEDPVTAQDGHTYEMVAIQEWFDRGHRNSPKTGAKLLSTELIPNYTLRSLIQDLKLIMPVLARHQLNQKNIEAAIQLREEEIRTLLIEKDNLLNQEREKKSALEKELEVMQQRIEQLEAKLEREDKTFESQNSQDSPSISNHITPFQAGAKVNDSTASQLANKIFYDESLWQAACNDHFETVKWLVIKGASLDDKNMADNTALLWAAINGNLEMLQWLLANGASLADKNCEGKTALLFAATKGNIEMVKWLLANGASIKEKDRDGRTAFLLAAFAGQLKMVQWLLAFCKNNDHHILSALLNEKDKYGLTALLLAAQNETPETVEWLVANGASLEEKDNHGNTTLLLAAWQGKVKVVQWLLSNGASLNEKNHNGETALDVAKSKVKNFLKTYNSQQPSVSQSNLFSNQSPKPSPQFYQNVTPGQK